MSRKIHPDAVLLQGSPGADPSHRQEGEDRPDDGSDRGLRTSRTGAVLGRPGAEHHSYGMSRDPDFGGIEAEREARGLSAPDTPRRRR